MDDTSRLHLDEAYFEGQYDGDEDPWGFDSRWYERRKFACTIAALPRARYRHGFEPGCANGALTELVAPRCDELVAYDLVPGCVERASRRLEGQPHVEIGLGTFPRDWPAGTSDLVIWSEVAYYLTDDGLAVAEAGLADHLEPGGDLIAVHYTGATNYPRSGADVGAWIDGLPFLTRRTSMIDPEFELGVWERT